MAESRVWMGREDSERDAPETDCGETPQPLWAVPRQRAGEDAIEAGGGKRLRVEGGRG